MIDVRPSAQGVRTARAGFVFGGVAVTVRACVSHGTLTAGDGIAAVSLVAVGLLGVELYRRNRLVSKDANQITVRTMFRLKHRIRLNAIHRAYFAPRFVNSYDFEASRLVLRDSEDRVLLRLDSSRWNAAEIAALAAELDVVELPTDLTGKELIRQFPQVASLAERHPWRVTAIWIGGVAVFSIALVWLITALSG